MQRFFEMPGEQCLAFLSNIGNLRKKKEEYVAWSKPPSREQGKSNAKKAPVPGG
jgi:hypothetical protein